MGHKKIRATDIGPRNVFQLENIKIFYYSAKSTFSGIKTIVDFNFSGINTIVDLLSFLNEFLNIFVANPVRRPVFQCKNMI